MVRAVLLCCAILGQDRTPASTSASAAPADRKSYEAARGQAGRDASAQVRLALWCEA